MENRFRAEEISTLLYQKYFAGSKMRGIRDPEFIERINATLICLICASIQHTLKAYRSGILKDELDFNYVNSTGKFVVPMPTV